MEDLQSTFPGLPFLWPFLSRQDLRWQINVSSCITVVPTPLAGWKRVILLYPTAQCSEKSVFTGSTIAVTSNNKFWSVDAKISTSMNSLELGKVSCDIAAMVLLFIITGRNNDSIAIALLQYKIWRGWFCFKLIVRKVVNLNIVCVTGIGRNGRTWSHWITVSDLGWRTGTSQQMILFLATTVNEFKLFRLTSRVFEEMMCLAAQLIVGI